MTTSLIPRPNPIDPDDEISRLIRQAIHGDEPSNVKTRAGIVLVLGRSLDEIMRVGELIGGGRDKIFGWLDGFHYADIEETMKVFNGIIVTMSPSVINNLEFESAEDLQSAIVLVDDQGEPRNLTEEEAWAMYRAYKVEIQHVSEILVTMGLW